MTTTRDTSEASRLRRWAILATMLSGTMLAILDSSILNILVVPIIEEFQDDLRTVEWVLTSHNLAFAVFLIGLGSLRDTVGRRRLCVLGQVVFVVGSGLPTVASGPWQLIAFRATQGLGAEALAPNALALMLGHFPEGERGPVLGIWGAAAGLGGALGPTLGGLVALAFLLGTWFVLMDLRVILRQDVIASNLPVFFALLIMAGSMFLSVLYAQLLADASPAATDVLLAPCAFVTVALAPLGGRLVDKVGPRVLAIVGLMTLAAYVAIPVWWYPVSAAFGMKATYHIHTDHQRSPSVPSGGFDG